MKRIILLLLFLVLWFGLSQPCFAMVRNIEEAPGHFVLQSRHQLKDKERSAWQIVLFARPKELQLRLVGFPDRYHFRHPDPLVLETISGVKLLAQDDFPKGKEVSNVGQYNLFPLVPDLPADQRLILTLPLEETVLQLTIPSAVIVEWQSVIEQQNSHQISQPGK